MTDARPVHEIRLGRVKAAIWCNETQMGVMHNVTFQRIYRTDDGWETTTSFGRDDLPLVAKVADMAHTWIYQEASNGKTESAQRNKKTRRRDQAATAATPF